MLLLVSLAMGKPKKIIFFVGLSLIAGIAMVSYFSLNEVYAQFPPQGCDLSDTSATLVIRFLDTGDEIVGHVAGPTEVCRSEVQFAGLGDFIDTEITRLDLVGGGPEGLPPITLSLGPGGPSTGQIIDNGDGSFFSFFDVFVQIDTFTPTEEPISLCNDLANPIEVSQRIFRIPPVGSFYEGFDTALLHVCGDTSFFPVAAIVHVSHLYGTNEDLKIEIKNEIIDIQVLILILVDLIQQLITQSETIRDNTTLQSGFRMASGDRTVLLDNAGIGGTSNVEVTWKLSDLNCRVVTLGGIIGAGGDGGPAALGGTLLIDDGAFGGNPSHADVTGTDAILVSAETDFCKLSGRGGDFVTVSTVGAGT